MSDVQNTESLKILLCQTMRIILNNIIIITITLLLINRVLKCDVIKMKFLKLWDLSGYSERTMSIETYLPNMSISRQIFSEIVAQLWDSSDS